eukprot:6213607-Pleurochrysis_carterae.AAC.1
MPCNHTQLRCQATGAMYSAREHQPRAAQSPPPRALLARYLAVGNHRSNDRVLEPAERRRLLRRLQVPRLVALQAMRISIFERRHEGLEAAARQREILHLDQPASGPLRRGSHANTHLCSYRIEKPAVGNGRSGDRCTNLVHARRLRALLASSSLLL